MVTIFGVFGREILDLRNQWFDQWFDCKILRGRVWINFRNVIKLFEINFSVKNYNSGKITLLFKQVLCPDKKKMVFCFLNFFNLI